MENLVFQIVQDDPTKRPNINQVVTQFEAIHAKMGAFQLRSPTEDRGNFSEEFVATLREWNFSSFLYWGSDLVHDDPSPAEK